MKKQERFDQLVDDVQRCEKCPRMCGSLRVLNRGCGPLDAPVMFVGEAPGRLGADRSALPFHGDKSGHNFEQLLAFAGLTRYSIFVTNSVLCNPKDERGNNAPPSTEEISNCAHNLRRQIDLIAPKIVVTLGATALRAAMTIEDQGLVLSTAVRTSTAWYGRLLVPLYHPGQRAMVHRSMANQRSDYRFVGDIVRRKGRVRNIRGTAQQDVLLLVERIANELSATSYFSLHKLFYLVEYEHLKRLGRRLTSSYIVRQKDGPYCVDLHPAKLKEARVDFIGSGSSLMVRCARKDLFATVVHRYNRETEEVIETVIQKFGRLSTDKLKTAVYLTGPMRSILRKEKAGVDLFNAPVLEIEKRA